MTETKTLNGLLKVKRNYGPSLFSVMASWLFYGMFRMMSYRLFFPFGMSFFGLALNYILLFSAISVTFRAFFTPRYSYTFQTEVENEEPSSTHEHPHESTFTGENSSTEMKTKTPSKPEFDEFNPLKTVETKKESKLEDERLNFCSYCGTEVPEIARFCSSCGERLR